jgi:hypothetical protein
MGEALARREVLALGFREFNLSEIGANFALLGRRFEYPDM